MSRLAAGCWWGRGLFAFVLIAGLGACARATYVQPLPCDVNSGSMTCLGVSGAPRFCRYLTTEAWGIGCSKLGIIEHERPAARASRDCRSRRCAQTVCLAVAPETITCPEAILIVVTGVECSLTHLSLEAGPGPCPADACTLARR